MSFSISWGVRYSRLRRSALTGLSGIVRFWCVGGTSRSLALACILLPPVELIVVTMPHFRSIAQRIQGNIELYFRAVLNLYFGRFGLNLRNSGRPLVAYFDSLNCPIFLPRNTKIPPAPH